VSGVLTIMGSGETAPTMAKVHRGLLQRVGGQAVLLDTPYGFQENADDISARAQEYFARSVGTPMAVASLRTVGASPAVVATAVARVRDAQYVFAGPGSPTYALRVWAGTTLPALLADRLAAGAAVTFASAAALTLGTSTVPVYEIYKAGEPLRWLDGLNLLEAATGLRAAVIPHYDNAEGGHHDTRYCYLGERRLRLLEPDLPPGAFVLGVDEHTGLILDLATRTATVVGLGGVTLRQDGSSTVLPTGTECSFDDLVPGRVAGPAAVPSTAAAAQVGRSPLIEEADRLDAAFTAALAARDVDAAVAALIELDEVMLGWSADTLQSDEPERARATLRSMVVRLGELARTGAADPRLAVAPLVELALSLRAAAREARDFATSDRVRDGLAAAGVEVRDTPDGVEWHLDADRAGGGGGDAC
jgi:hypothetical protein